ncbi:phenylalanine ammonia-lyase [Sanghuangporus baumii]|uniref:Phenylalanine ammonia-lyase n=1 Tax=Sanghuangporus baumii TaxID=108892 RepID=A0A9Q5I3I8_SANBA|nr:phenylalanine ammonia-lyase [Sanghuangporus baumii]
MVVNSDGHFARPHSNSHSGSVTTTIVSPRIEHTYEDSCDYYGHGIPLRVPTPEDLVKHKALLNQAACLKDFIASYQELDSYKNGASISLTGDDLTLSAVVAVARYPELVSAAIDEALASLSRDDSRIEALNSSRKIIDDKLAQNKSIYGVSTGFGGSADTRTAEHDLLGFALLQHQHSGVLPTGLQSVADANATSGAPSSAPSTTKSNTPLPLSSSASSLSMPAAWTRAAMVVRLNSLLRGHSAASLPLLNAMGGLLSKNVTPIVPLRGSISASGDLSPLSYIAGTLIGERGIYCYVPSGEKHLGEELGMSGEGTKVLRAPDALKSAGLQPIRLRPKEQLAILNGTAFSCGAAALCVEEARQLIMLGTVCTAMGTEAMRGSADSFCEFIQRVRPHPGQIETGALLTHLLETSKLATRHAEPGHSAAGNGIEESMAETGKDKIIIDEETIDADAGVLRQDRYPLRTAPQWLGPQLETIQRAAEVIAIECNSTTDNPLIDPATGIVHHGGNFQAMAVTSVLEPLRLSLFHIGKILFAQATELQNPLMSNGLTGNLASTDASLNFAGKGIDIAMAAYVAELAYLANPVSTGVQSAEMHNQAVNSLAFVSARYTLQAIEIVQMVVASYIYLLCQAVDLRALQKEMEEKTHEIVEELVKEHFAASEVSVDVKEVSKAVWTSFDTSANMDAKPRAEKAAKASTQPLVDQLLSSHSVSFSLASLPAFQSSLSARIYNAHTSLTTSYLSSTSSPSSPAYLPALLLLGRTKSLYTFVRSPVSQGGLGIGMHGHENLQKFVGGLGNGDASARGTIGGDVSAIYESIRDGRMGRVVVSMFAAEE